MTENIEYVKNHYCLRCGYKWIQKGNETPKACPRCKSYKWDVERKVKPDNGVQEAMNKLSESLKSKL